MRKHTSHDLDRLGWNADLAAQFAARPHDGLVPGRVGAQHRGAYVLYTESGDLWAEVSGRFRHDAGEDLPVVGDWVAARASSGDGRGVVHDLLPRRTAFVRVAGDLTRPRRAVREQVVAANVDVAFVTTALGHDLNPRRLERYLAAASESGADPVVVVTKIDLYPDASRRLIEVESAAFGVPVQAVSNVTGEGLAELGRWLVGSRTVALLGPSGVGKSSLVNRLLGEELQAVREIRADGRGRHTTSHRELFVVPTGGLVLDTPGMRHLGLWDAEGGVETAFADVEEAAAACRFSDCRHGTEPGCAVRAALEEGALEEDRLASYTKLQRELAYPDRKHGMRASADERRRLRAVELELRRRPRGGR